MALPLHIPPCICEPVHPLHSPPFERPLRVQVDGLLVSIQKLLPELQWNLDSSDFTQSTYPQPAALQLARLAYRALYQQHARDDVPGDLIVRDECLGWIRDTKPWREIDYYAVTFDHLVPQGEEDPETLALNIIDTDSDDGAYANQHLAFRVDSTEYRDKKLLTVPRCCQKRKGTGDRQRINSLVTMRDENARHLEDWRKRQQEKEVKA